LIRPKTIGVIAAPFSSTLQYTDSLGAKATEKPIPFQPPMWENEFDCIVSFTVAMDVPAAGRTEFSYVVRCDITVSTELYRNSRGWPVILV